MALTLSSIFFLIAPLCRLPPLGPFLNMSVMVMKDTKALAVSASRLSSIASANMFDVVVTRSPH